MATTLQEYRKKLDPIVFRPDGAPRRKLAAELAALSERLPTLPRDLEGSCNSELGKLLTAREAAFRKHMGRFYEQKQNALAAANLKAAHSYEIMFAHSQLLDALHIAAFNAAQEDWALLIRLRAMEAGDELEAKQAQLGKKRSGRRRATRAASDAADGDTTEQERAYYAQLEDALDEEISGAEEAVERLRACLPVWRRFRANRRDLQKRLVLFARGGYGRAEVSFSSDMDTGYCVDTCNIRPGEVEIYQDLVVRTELLLRACGMNPAQQYFEIDEDLSRFTAPETIHTIPAILESRPILGNAGLLELLKDKFSSILPYEEFLRIKVAEYEAQVSPTLTQMDVKEDRGGLRCIQIPLWILGVTHKAGSFMSADLVELARRKGLLSIWEATRYLLALEMLNELRNFLGLAEHNYYDQEARAGNFDIQDFPPNRIHDGLARLYVFRKNRYPSLDALDSARLRLAADVAHISDALLARVLDRTVTHGLGGIKISVHLGRKRIIRFAGGRAKSSGRMSSIFPSGAALLGLAGFIARTDYDLSEELKDELAEVVRGFARSPGAKEKALRAERFNEIMGAPHAHRALATMLEISDPLSPRRGTLLGAFIPEFDNLLYLLRDAGALNMPVHEHVMASVENGQKSLEWLNQHYHELHALLSPSHMLALRWSLLLHGLGKIQGARPDPAHSAELAVEALDRLGCNNEELESHVRLLVQHHQTIIGLSRAATYFDQALVEYFEVAGRQMVNVVLIFLVNRAILMAGGSAWGEVEHLNRFFEETSRILAAARGIPEQSRSLEIINNYLYDKKEELQAETRAQQLLNRSIAVGLDRAIFNPVRKHAPEAWENLKALSERFGELHKGLVLGQQSEEEQSHTRTRLVRELRNAIGEQGISAITAEDRRAFSWFFCAFPNRYLLSSMPARLAGQIGKFEGFEREKAMVDVVGGGTWESAGLLVSTRDLAQSHSQVAYMLSRKRINIISGKVNRVELGNGRHGYCYYFQISNMGETSQYFPKELEGMILGETPPELKMAPLTSTPPLRGSRLDFLGDDGKGYAIKPVDGVFVRENSPFHVVRVVLRDEPFLFFKVARAFDLYEVEIQQALITTTGNQVVDYFYLTAEDYERLRASSFQERFAGIMRVSLI